MTIIAGFRGRGGSVLCSDGLEVQGGYAKKLVDKIKLCSKAHEPESIRFQFAIGCSGSGPYMDMLQGELVATLELLATSSKVALDELPTMIRDAMIDILVEFYGKHIWPRPSAAASADMQFLLLIQPRPYGEECFIKIIETAVTILDDCSFACIGIGSYLAEYILENMLSGPGAKQHQLALAAYVLSEVNSNVEGCGNGYSIYHFDENGKVSWTSSDYPTEEFTGMKDIFRWAFQTMTDIDPQVDGFTPEKLGTLIDRQRLLRAKRLEKEIAIHARFAQQVSDNPIEK